MITKSRLRTKLIQETYFENGLRMKKSSVKLTYVEYCSENLKIGWV